MALSVWSQAMWIADSISGNLWVWAEIVVVHVNVPSVMLVVTVTRFVGSTMSDIRTPV